MNKEPTYEELKHKISELEKTAEEAIKEKDRLKRAFVFFCNATHHDVPQIMGLIEAQTEILLMNISKDDPLYSRADRILDGINRLKNVVGVVRERIMSQVFPRSEKQTNIREKAIEEQNRLKDTINQMLFEFNQPIATIEAYAELLSLKVPKSDPLHATINEAVSAILEETNRSEDMLKAMGRIVQRGWYIQSKKETNMEDNKKLKDPVGLERFVQAQNKTYEGALSELIVGQKTGHWMWYIFPQIDGLGRSHAAKRFAIRSLEEAREYLDHPVLGARLLECSEAALSIMSKDGYPVPEVFGYLDAMKLKSCMTLFEYVSEPGNVFALVLDKFFQGDRDAKTLLLLETI